MTTSSKKERLEGYLSVGDIHLTEEDVAAIDKAGSKGQFWSGKKMTAVSRVGRIVVLGLAAYGVSKAVDAWFGL